VVGGCIGTWGALGVRGICNVNSHMWEATDTMEIGKRSVSDMRRTGTYSLLSNEEKGRKIINRAAAMRTVSTTPSFTKEKPVRDARRWCSSSCTNRRLKDSAENRW